MTPIYQRDPAYISVRAISDDKIRLTWYMSYIAPPRFLHPPMIQRQHLFNVVKIHILLNEDVRLAEELTL